MAIIDFTRASDLDFLVEFSGSASLHDYLGLRENLRSLFGRDVDLVMPGAVRNPYIRAAIERDRQLLVVGSCFLMRKVWVSSGAPPARHVT